jgi:ribosomal protein S2
MINKKYKRKKIQKEKLLLSLFKSRSFYGESLNKLNKGNLPYIYGIRHKHSIINLKQTILLLKRSLNLISYYKKKNKCILIIGNSLDLKFLLNKLYIKNNKNIIFFNKTWINGLLTNKSVYSFLNKKKVELIVFLKSDVKF